jgi:hypothetical protein
LAGHAGGLEVVGDAVGVAAGGGGRRSGEQQDQEE